MTITKKDALERLAARAEELKERARYLKSSECTLKESTRGTQLSQANFHSGMVTLVTELVKARTSDTLDLTKEAFDGGWLRLVAPKQSLSKVCPVEEGMDVMDILELTKDYSMKTIEKALEINGLKVVDHKVVKA